MYYTVLSLSTLQYKFLIHCVYNGQLGHELMKALLGHINIKL